MELLNNYYFPGGNTTKSFFNYYDQILDYKTLKKIYTIKGGPGVGKSTFMKEIGKKFEEMKYHINYYHCSSDPYSLDGIYIKEKNILFVDGTSPHIIDPKYPGVLYEMINLAVFFDENKLITKKDEIINLTNKITSTFNISYKYLYSLYPLYENLNNMYENALIKERFYLLIRNLTDTITRNITGKNYKEKRLFLSAITPLGFKNFLDRTVKCKNVYIINSYIGDLSYKILEKIRDILEIKEFEIECFMCPIGPENRIEHLIIPEIDTAIITSNKYHPFFNGNTIKTVDLYDKSLLDNKIIEYDLKTIDELLNHSVSILNQAKKEHDVLEEYYKKSMDYKSLDEYTKNFINEL